LTAAQVPPGVTIIDVAAIAGWSVTNASPVSRSPVLRALVSSGVHALLTAYFSSRFARRIFDRLGMSALVLKSPVFDLPSADRRAALLAALPAHLIPRLVQEDADLQFPILVETWRRDGKLQVHLVNYSDQPQIAELSFPAPVNASIISPDRTGVIRRSGQVLEIPIDIYSILIIEDA
jgi:hypothetical protein